MRHIRIACAVIAAVSAAAACKKSDKQEAAPAARAAAGSATAGSAPIAQANTAVAAVQDKVEQGKAMVASVGKDGLTPDVYEQLIVALASCEIKALEIDAKCPALIALRDATQKSSTALGDLAGVNANVGKKLLGHPAPPVRLYAAGLMGGLLGTGTASEEAIVEAASKETDLRVLRQMIRTVANAGAKNPRIGKLLLESAAHADASVRLQAVYALSSAWNRELAGGPEKLAAMIDGDADTKVREAACEHAGQLGVASLVATYQKHTAPTAEPGLAAKCFAGLVAMFHHYPLYETGEPAAYKLFLERLAAKPRTSALPPWSVMDAFSYFGDDAKNDKLVAWKKKATWFKPAEVKKVLADVIADPRANWMARSGAVTSMVGLGATKAELEAIKKKYATPAGDDTHVVKKLDEAIAKAP